MSYYEHKRDYRAATLLPFPDLRITYDSFFLLM